MNSFGRLFRLSVFGESHGPMIGVVLDGVAAGISLSAPDFDMALQRRRGGASGTTPRKEKDEPIFLSGVFNGFTTGAPLTIAFENGDVRSKDYSFVKQIPRPGHADFVASKKYKGFEDYRGGGHFSGRLTLCWVAAGVVAEKMIRHLYKDAAFMIESKVISIGGDPDIERAVQSAVVQQDSLGGIVECVMRNVPIGLGEPFFDSFESMLSHAVFSIPAIKGIEFGSGFRAASMKGSEHNDMLNDTTGKYGSNHAGGINGGLSNGNDIEFRVAVKPASSTPQNQQTLNIATGEMETLSVKGRHDLCIALRVPPVLEAVAACVLADLMCVHSVNQ